VLRLFGFRSGTRGDYVVDDMEKADKALVEEVKEEWKQLWLWRIDDKVRAEGIASRTFPRCFVDRGTIIVATRDFKPLDLKEILGRNRVGNVERVVGPHWSVGGWTRFARTVLNNQARSRMVAWEEPRRERVKSLQLKKGGRGWVHRIE
jgi:hypothetical protein